MGSLEPFKKDRPFSLFVARQRVEWAQYLAKQPRPDHNILLRGLASRYAFGYIWVHELHPGVRQAASYLTSASGLTLHLGRLGHSGAML
jgi:hypothetical protein